MRDLLGDVSYIVAGEGVIKFSIFYCKTTEFNMGKTLSLP
jgi:hypothetical protein